MLGRVVAVVGPARWSAVGVEQFPRQACLHFPDRPRTQFRFQGGGATQLGRVVQQVQGQEPAGGADQGQLTSAGEDQPSQGGSTTLTQGLGQHAVGGLGGRSVGGQVQTASGEQGG